MFSFGYCDLYKPQEFTLHISSVWGAPYHVASYVKSPMRPVLYFLRWHLLIVPAYDMHISQESPPLNLIPTARRFNTQSGETYFDHGT